MERPPGSRCPIQGRLTGRGRPAHHADHVSLTRYSGLCEFLARVGGWVAFPAAWRRLRMDRKVPPDSTVPKKPSDNPSSRSMMKVAMSWGRCRGVRPEMRADDAGDLPFTATQGGESRL